MNTVSPGPNVNPLDNHIFSLMKSSAEGENLGTFKEYFEKIVIRIIIFSNKVTKVH
jgi:hypothetical protein